MTAIGREEPVERIAFTDATVPRSDRPEWSPQPRIRRGPLTATLPTAALKHFQAKWVPVRVKKMREFNNLKPPI
jgi:hypothetical protein